MRDVVVAVADGGGGRCGGVRGGGRSRNWLVAVVVKRNTDNSTVIAIACTLVSKLRRKSKHRGYQGAAEFVLRMRSNNHICHKQPSLGHDPGIPGIEVRCLILGK